MKKYKKGFIIMVILLVVVIVLAVFGIAYYMGKSSNSSFANLPKLEEDLPREDQVVNNNPSDCSPITAPWIKVISPNGGEVYEMGQKVDIKWKTCNAQTGQTVSLNIGTEVPASKNNGISGAFNQVVSFYPLKITNDGIENVTLSGSSTNGNWSFISGENYKISVVLNPLPTNTQETSLVQDMSDNYFTINKKNTTSINTDIYGRYVSKDCKVVSGCNGPIECVNKDSEPMASACVALPEFVCYKTSTVKCEKQALGNCGWTYTDTLESCINTYSSKDLRKNGENCGDGIGNCQIGLKCGYPCGIPGCQNVCMPENELPKP